MGSLKEWLTGIVRLMPLKMRVHRISTPRCILTKLTAHDGEKYFRLSNNPNVMKYVTGYALSREESDQMLLDITADNGAHRYLGRYLVEGADGQLVGVAKLDQIGEEVEIGYRVQEEYWGKGFATELAVCLISFAGKTLNASTVVAYVNVNNKASIRVLEKAGMRNVETIEDLDEIKHKFVFHVQL